MPRGCRSLVSLRDPKDAVVSLYRFMEGWFIEPGAIPIDEVVERRSFDCHDGARLDVGEHEGVGSLTVGHRRIGGVTTLRSSI